MKGTQSHYSGLGPIVKSASVSKSSDHVQLNTVCFELEKLETCVFELGSFQNF